MKRLQMDENIRIKHVKTYTNSNINELTKMHFSVEINIKMSVS